MAEHRMDTKVLQALLATAWQDGYFSGRDDEAIAVQWEYTPNPYWKDSGRVEDLKIATIHDTVLGDADNVTTWHFLEDGDEEL